MWIQEQCNYLDNLMQFLLKQVVKPSVWFDGAGRKARLSKNLWWLYLLHFWLYHLVPHEVTAKDTLFFHMLISWDALGYNLYQDYTALFGGQQNKLGLGLITLTPSSRSHRADCSSTSLSVYCSQRSVLHCGVLRWWHQGWWGQQA